MPRKYDSDRPSQGDPEEAHRIEKNQANDFAFVARMRLAISQGRERVRETGPPENLED